MSQVLTKTADRVREAWGMIERAQRGDTLAVGVALDYVMEDGCSRGDAKLELYRHVARVITESASGYGEQSVATLLSLILYDGHVRGMVSYNMVFNDCSDEEWKNRVQRQLELCSWVEGVE